jgi:hypothetical protein
MWEPLFRQAQRARRGNANGKAHANRYRRRRRDRPDLVGRSDVRVGPHRQRRRYALTPSPLDAPLTPAQPVIAFACRDAERLPGIRERASSSGWLSSRCLAGAAFVS